MNILLNDFFFRRLLLPFLLCIFLFPTLAEAARVGDLAIDADSMFRDTVKQVIHLKGNVQVLFKNQHLKTDAATIFMQSKEIEAKGRVILVSPETYAEGDSLVMSYEKETGVIYNGFIQMGQVSFEGSVIYKKGRHEFEAYDGSYTACTTCPPAWSFTGSRVTGTFGGSATIRNPIFRVAKFPIFWLPYVVVPLNSKRQTGFLFPSFEYGETSGLAVAESFFWVMGENKDSTWTIKNYENRGLKLLSNYRYVLSQSSWGELDAAYIRDRVFRQDNRLSLDQQGRSQNRWFGRYRQYFDLPSGWIQRANINLVRDLAYARDFSNEVYYQGDPSMESNLSLTKNGDVNHLSVDLNHHTNLLKTDPLEDNRDAIHRLPYIRYSRSPQPVGESKLLFDINAHYVNFARDGRVFDNIERNLDGSIKRVTDVSNEGSIKHTLDGSGTEIIDTTFTDPNGAYDDTIDQIRAGQRLDVQPRLSYPLRVGSSFDLLPSATFRETRYQFNLGSEPAAERRYVRGGLSARTYLNGYFGNMDDQDGVRYKHEIRPEISYTAIPYLHQSSHSFFGSVAGEPNFTLDQPITNVDAIQFDYEDRVFERNLMTFGFTNTLTRRTWGGDQASYKQIGIFRVSQSYDIYEQYRTTNDVRVPFSPVSSLLDLRLDNFETNTTLNYHPYHNVTTFSSRVKFFNELGDFAQTTYSQNYTLVQKKFISATNRIENIAMGVGKKTKYITVGAGITYSREETLKDFEGRYYFKDYSYALVLNPPGDCWSIHWSYTKPYQAEAVISLGFLMNYGAGNSKSIGTKF